MKHKIESLLLLVSDEIFMNSYRHFAKIYDFIKNSNIDVEIKELVEEYKLKYFIEGWNILVGIMKITFFLSLLIFLFIFGLNNPLTIRCLIMWAILITLSTILNFSLNKFKLIRENAFLVIQLMIGFAWINGNLVNSSYSFYESWFVYCYMSQFCSIMMWINYK